VSDGIDLIFHIVLTLQVLTVLTIDSSLGILYFYQYLFPTLGVFYHIDFQDHSSHTELTYEISDSSVFTNL